MQEDFGASPLAYLNYWRMWVNKPGPFYAQFQSNYAFKFETKLNNVIFMVPFFISHCRLTTPLNTGPQQMSQNDVGPHCQIGGNSPLVMPGFPLRSSHSVHTPHYSPYSPSR